MIASGYLGDTNVGTVDVTGSDITTLVFNNNTGDPTGDSDSWLFGVASLSASSVTGGTSVPEPSSLPLLLAGLGAIAGAFYLARRKAKSI